MDHGDDGHDRGLRYDLPKLLAAGRSRREVLTSQIALPADICDAAYATSGYAQSAANFSRTSIASDNVFGDNSAEQMAVMTPAMSGDTVAGFEGTLSVGVPGI